MSMIGTSRKEILGRGSTPREALDDWHKQFTPYWEDALPTTAQLTWIVAPEINCIDGTWQVYGRLSLK